MDIFQVRKNYQPFKKMIPPDWQNHSYQNHFIYSFCRVFVHPFFLL
jgi:hypothetical protein